MDSILIFFTENFWATASTIVALTTSITAVINNKLNPNKIWKQVIAWLVSIALTVGGYFLGMVNVVEPEWFVLIVTGFIVGLASNGFYTIPVIKSFINSWFTVTKLAGQKN